MADFTVKSAIFTAARQGLVAPVSTASGPDRRLNGRVANELCHTKRWVNADELGRIT